MSKAENGRTRGRHRESGEANGNVAQLRFPPNCRILNLAVLDGEVAVPCNLQSAAAGLKSR